MKNVMGSVGRALKCETNFGYRNMLALVSPSEMSFCLKPRYPPSFPIQPLTPVLPAQ